MPPLSISSAKVTVFFASTKPVDCDLLSVVLNRQYYLKQQKTPTIIANGLVIAEVRSQTSRPRGYRAYKLMHNMM